MASGTSPPATSAHSVSRRPYGHKPLDATRISFNMDIVGGAVASLCEVHRQAMVSDQAGHWVHLLFDRETEAVEVESPYTHPHLRVRARRPGPLFVRIPAWVKPETVELTGVESSPGWSNGYLVIGRPALGRWIDICFDLAEQQIVLKHRTRDISAHLRGDSVAAMSNFGAELTFFPPLG